MCQPGDILMHSIFHAVDFLGIFIGNTYTLLESTINFYFRSMENPSGPADTFQFQPTWSKVMALMRQSFAKLQLTPIIHGNHFHMMHLFLIHEMQRLNGHVKEQVVFLQDLCQLLDGLKST